MVKIGLDITFMIQLISSITEVVVWCSLKSKLLKILTRKRKKYSHNDESIVDIGPIPITDKFIAYKEPMIMMSKECRIYRRCDK